MNGATDHVSMQLKQYGAIVTQVDGRTQPFITRRRNEQFKLAVFRDSDYRLVPPPPFPLTLDEPLTFRSINCATFVDVGDIVRVAYHRRVP